jgi:hypothetical protein
VRRGTLIAIVVLFVLLIVAAVYQVRAAQGPRRYPGPGFTATPPASATVSPSSP